jgi:hypothetical protein
MDFLRSFVVESFANNNCEEWKQMKKYHQNENRFQSRKGEPRALKSLMPTLFDTELNSFPVRILCSFRNIFCDRKKIFILFYNVENKLFE